MPVEETSLGGNGYPCFVGLISHWGKGYNFIVQWTGLEGQRRGNVEVWGGGVSGFR